MQKIEIIAVFFLLGLGVFGCQGQFTPTVPNFNPKVTGTPTPAGLSPSTTVTPTLTGSNTPTTTGTFTATWTATGSPTATATVTFTLTGSPTPAISPTATIVCPPTYISLGAGVSVMNYGQGHLYVIRTQSDWDAYTGITGSTPPVNFSSQMLLAENWGTEYCQPGAGQPNLGMVVTYNIASVCVNASSIDVRITYGSTCTCGGSCVYTMAPTQVSAVILPASSLPVSITP